MTNDSDNNVLCMLPETHAAFMRAIQNDPLDILLVEDTTSDAVLTKVSLTASGLAHRLRTLQKGNEVMPHLLQCKELSHDALPDVILLDLGLPGINGFDLLADLAEAEPVIRSIPIIILTGHHDFEYLAKIYNLWIAAHIHKPCSVEALQAALMRIVMVKASLRD